MDRQKVLDFLVERNLVNTIIITGDNHNNWVRNVPPVYLRLDAEPVATEFIGTSVSTGGDRTINTTYGGDVNNPHFRFFDNHHGYVRCKLTPELWTTDFRIVPTVLSPDAPVSTLASFVVEQGRAGAQLNSSVELARNLGAGVIPPVRPAGHNSRALPHRVVKWHIYFP